MNTTEVVVQNGTVSHEGHGEEIHLVVEPIRGGADSVVAARWCICPSIFAVMKGRPSFSHNPHLLLVISQGGREEERRLMPLEQEMEYIYFHRSGQHRIQATIVCGESTHKLRRFLFEKSHKSEYYDVALLDYDGDLRDPINDANSAVSLRVGAGEVDVNVEAKFFAKEPPAWLAYWANLWFETKLKDECHLRKRCLLAFSLQPSVVLMYLAIVCPTRFIVALFLKLAFGLRGVSIEPSYSPFLLDTRDIWDDSRGTIYTRAKNGKERSWFVVLFTPIIPALLVGVVYGAMLFWDRFAEFWWAPVVVIGILIGVTVVGYFFLLIGWLIAGIVSAFPKTSVNKKQKKIDDARARLREELKRLADLKKFENTYSSLVCQGVPVRASLAALPRNRRTIHLRFMDLKTKVCRPFES